VAAAAAFLERAANLTPDPSRRGIRALAAGQLEFDAGAPDAAERLLTIAATSPLEELDRARLERLRAQIAFARTRGSDTPSLLSAAAQLLEPLDPELARETHLEALWAAIRSGRFATVEGVVEAAQAAAPTAGGEPSRAIDLLLDAVLARLSMGYEPAVPAVARALEAFRAEGFSRENIVWCGLACQLALELWDDAGCEEIASGLRRVARESGRLTVLPFALNYSVARQLFLGQFSVAEHMLAEAETITSATRMVPIPDYWVLLAAWRGDRERTYALRTVVIEAATERGEGMAIELAERATAGLHNGLGEYAEAMAAAERAYEHDGLWPAVRVLPELIEAAAHNGDRQTAEVALERLAERSSKTSSEWGRGLEAAGRALLSEGFRAEKLHREAIERLGRSRLVVLQIRARLNYGEWLRRENRRRDAREQLRTAHEQFTTIGMQAFAERARRELQATGEKARKRTVETRDDLTAQERQIAQLARDGMSNTEIGARLFLSPRTVEWHLRKVFGKLGIHHRQELASALTSSEPQLVEA
jgi:DNA-binding CsgD family transcriptional regulator